MKTIRRSGRSEQPYFKDTEIDRIAVEELLGAGLLPSKPEPIRIERFVEKRFGLARVSYEELPTTVLGYTQFSRKGVEAVFVSRALAEEGTRVSERRINSTLAHEAGHGLLHAYLFMLDSFPTELFENDDFVVSMNIAKWHVWLACLSDLAVHAGALLRRGRGGSPEEVGGLIRGLVDEILRETGIPAEAGPEYPDHANRVRARLALYDWGGQADDESAFVESPTALVYWAPIVDDLKALDEEIVRNSIRYRWIEVRRELHRNLDAAGVMGTSQSHGG